MSVTTDELNELLKNGSFNFHAAFISSVEFAEANPDFDEEELEFLLSWMATQASRKKMARPNSWGFALAVELESRQLGRQLGGTEAEQLSLIAEIMWPQVESILVSESDEPELTWYAAQELADYLPAWRA